MHDPDAMQVFPYVRYHAQNDGRTRSEHSHLDGKIFHKDDPFLRTHTPPWEFNCRCYLEEITAGEAGKHRKDIQEPTPADKVTVESRSGFSFDPAHVFEEFELSGIKDVQYRRDTCREMCKLADKSGGEVTFVEALSEKKNPVIQEPENLDEIRKTLEIIKKSVNSHEPGTQYTFPDVQCSLGFISKERFDAIALQPEDDVPVIFESPGASDYGMTHWKGHHLDDWKKDDAVEFVLNALRETIWNKNSALANTYSKKGKRLSITSPDGKYIANMWKRGKAWVYSIQDVWDQSESSREK